MCRSPSGAPTDDTRMGGENQGWPSGALPALEGLWDPVQDMLPLRRGQWALDGSATSACLGMELPWSGVLGG